jgi:hypothetical protein
VSVAHGPLPLPAAGLRLAWARHGPRRPRGRCVYRRHRSGEAGHAAMAVRCGAVGWQPVRTVLPLQGARVRR